MKDSCEIIGLDDGIPASIVGCDPGPTHCAVALVTRVGNKLTLCWANYVPVDDLFDAFNGAPFPTWTTKPFGFSFEKVVARYGAVPGATTFDTCRNAGVLAAVAAAHRWCRAIYGVGPVDWRVALGGSPNMKDSEVRRELMNLFGELGDRYIATQAKAIKAKLKLPAPITCHLRDAVGVAVGTFLMKRRGVGADARLVWKDMYHAQ